VHASSSQSMSYANYLKCDAKTDVECVPYHSDQILL
jgi:hypothetical protein